MSVEIALRAARVRYGPLEALHGLDLALPAGTVTVLLGRNGSGRSTALRALAGTVPLSGGRVEWRGADVTRVPAHVRARRGLCFVPDLRAVHATLTVAENLDLAAPGRQDDALAAYPELARLLGHRAATLSGGERRMLALARAVCSAARVVLVDEPSLGLSATVASRTYELLAALAGPPARAAVVLAEQRVPAGLPPGSLAYELRRGSLADAREIT
ncbi:ATP-binding cassette domain-containing protein [Streptomyces sp. SKN60]|uniref:ATP-binding cassette domain-containing protein n=1 Tax=Streptomyces sp. SKN60 TaxID=2855506 RepID=UPI002247D4D2|nr:ATP-binding cassette domain-containing protein [Streptomyces sp. SKN60]MCX2182615.1 ATP-binding cassette domain-containing protein [Streptomyces sp. SKN60]